MKKRPIQIIGVEYGSLRLEKLWAELVSLHKKIPAAATGIQAVSRTSQGADKH